MNKGYLLEKEIVDDPLLNNLVIVRPTDYIQPPFYSYSLDTDSKDYFVVNKQEKPLKKFKSYCEIPFHSFSESLTEDYIQKIHLHDIRQKIYDEIFQKIYKLGTESVEDTYGWWRKLKKRIFKFFGKKYFKTYNVRSYNVINIYDLIFYKLKKLSFETDGEPYILTSPKVAKEILGTYKGIKEYNEKSTDLNYNPVSLYGYLNGVSVFIHNKYYDGNIFLGVKSKQNFTGLNLFYLRNKSSLSFKEKESGIPKRCPIYSSRFIMNLSISEIIPNKAKENYYRIRIKTKN